MLLSLAAILVAQDNPDARTMFDAKGDGKADDTEAIQKCIDYSATHRASCFVPPGIYRITGAGLHILSGQPSIYGLQSMGNGAPVLQYYGTGTCLSIGDGTHRMYAINLRNIACSAADGVKAQYGINAQNISGGDWSGVTIGGGATTGVFAIGIRFSDAGSIHLDHLILSNKTYTAGTVGLLLDEFAHYGNGPVTLDISDQSNMERMFELRNCASCRFSKFYVENSREAVSVDSAHTAQLGSVVFDNGEINTSGTGAPGHSVLAITGAKNKLLTIDQLRFTNCRFFLAGGVTSPILMNVDSEPAPSSHAEIFIDHTTINGALDSVVKSNSSLIAIHMEDNYVRDNTGKIRTRDIAEPAPQ